MKCPKRGKIGRPIPTSEDKPLHPTSINPFRKSVYKTFSFIKKALRKMLRISFALAFTRHFDVFSNLGLSTLTVREVARDKSLAMEYLGNIAVMKLIFEERKDKGKSKRYIFKLKRI